MHVVGGSCYLPHGTKLTYYYYYHYYYFIILLLLYGVFLVPNEINHYLNVVSIRRNFYPFVGRFQLLDSLYLPTSLPTY